MKKTQPTAATAVDPRTNSFDNGNMKAMSLLLAAVIVVVVSCMDVASSAQKDIPKTAIDVMLSVLYAASAVWIFVTLVLGWTMKLTTSLKYKSRKNNKMNFQKIGAMVFGMGAMVYSSLGIAEFVSLAPECRYLESIFGPLLSIAFTSLQVYFLLVYAKVTINMGKVVPILSRFGLMVIMGTNISVWIHTTISEARHSSEEAHHSDSSHSVKNDTNYTYACAGGITLQRQLSSYLYPCVIEYSLITSTNIYLIWSKICQPTHAAPPKTELSEDNLHAKCNGYVDPKSVRKSSSIARMEHLGHGPHHVHFDHPHGHHGSHGHVNRAFSAVLADIIEESGSEGESSAHSEPATPKQKTAEESECNCFNSFKEGVSGHQDSCPVKEKDQKIEFSSKADEVKFYFGEASDAASDHHEHVELHDQASHSNKDMMSVSQVTRHVADWHRHNNDHSQHTFLEASDLVHTGRSTLTNVASSVSIATSAYEAPHMPDVKEAEYYNNHCGLYIGLTIALATLVTIIVFLNLLYADSSDILGRVEYANAHLFIAKISLNILNIFALFITHFSINSLMKKDPNLRGLRLGKEGRRHSDEKHQQHQLALDKALLGISFIGLMGYCTLTIIAGLGVTDPEVDAGLTTADAAIVMIEAVLQTVFLVTSFLPRRATTPEQREKRPGRQGLFFLLCCNFCLWGLNSFGLRNEIANSIQISFYTVNAWVILSHVTLPLMILYRFHSIVVISDVITHAYTPKYIGLDTHKI
ncbi:uncharacterized protein LOC106153354 isoform X2 [Lingula anatina]|uniref:Uncharacterized protein LOC106153354 isoform X2 n=1 Tax=Lingula anatina TaxID=7574 RepID=A0A1S3H9C6_LINAN|nr:uncharacterized protein LOC106153354 isoform X2 [Lingula anatina]|eukprot:XP_013382700.1 uncharacterized protein LOC106153354 isoform X2 [Lingula anatina]